MSDVLAHDLHMLFLLRQDGGRCHVREPLISGQVFPAHASLHVAPLWGPVSWISGQGALSYSCQLLATPEVRHKGFGTCLWGGGEGCALQCFLSLSWRACGYQRCGSCPLTHALRAAWTCWLPAQGIRIMLIASDIADACQHDADAGSPCCCSCALSYAVTENRACCLPAPGVRVSTFQACQRCSGIFIDSCSEALPEPADRLLQQSGSH